MRRGSGLRGLLLDVALEGNRTVQAQPGTMWDSDCLKTISIPERQEIAVGLMRPGTSCTSSEGDISTTDRAGSDS